MLVENQKIGDNITELLCRIETVKHPSYINFYRFKKGEGLDHAKQSFRAESFSIIENTIPAVYNEGKTIYPLLEGDSILEFHYSGADSFEHYFVFTDVNGKIIDWEDRIWNTNSPNICP